MSVKRADRAVVPAPAHGVKDVLECVYYFV